MAKRQSVNRSGSVRQTAITNPSSRDPGSILGWLQGFPFGENQAFVGAYLQILLLGLFAALLVFGIHRPSDSTAVEHGDALYLSALALFVGGLAWMGRPAIGNREQTGFGIGIDVIAWGLAGWVAWACWKESSHSNLRFAVNETWLWIAGAAVFTGSRRCFHTPVAKRALIVLFVVCMGGLSIHGWHQETVSLPVDRARYASAPDEVLRSLGIDAPEGSSQRMHFENRLRDGGPTATFALANSFAGPLLFAWILSVGILLTDWKQMGRLSRIVWALSACLVGSMLQQTGSRSAVVVACVIPASLLILRYAKLSGGGLGNREDRRTEWHRFRKLFLGVVVLASVVGGTLYVWGLAKPERIEAAWRSVSFRMQYWRSTLALVTDSPWSGCGPGNFQAAYQRYREPTASEAIADPHNWFMETLAAGGFPAGLLACLLVYCTCYVVCHRGRSNTKACLQENLSESGPQSSLNQFLAASIFGGALLGIFAVWGLGITVGQLPDIDAQLFAIPVAGLLAVGLWTWIKKGVLSQLVLMGAIVGILIHLGFSGGWTIPGVAVPLWIFSGLAIPIDPMRPKPDGTHWSVAASDSQRWSVRYIRCGLGLLTFAMLFGLLMTALRPVERVSSAQHAAKYDLMRGEARQAAKRLQQAAAVDRWDPRPLIDAGYIYKNQIVGLSEIRHQASAQLSVQYQGLQNEWDETIRRAIDRAPTDPLIWLQGAQQQLHLYQRWGQKFYLEGALERLLQIADMAPADERVAAQVAVIYRARGERAKAIDWTDRARRVSEAGSHITRQLERILVIVPQPIGIDAINGPQRAFASNLLTNDPIE